MKEKVKLLDKIGACLGIMLSSLFISLIPFGFLISKYGFNSKFYLVLLIGFSVGVLWSIKVIKRGNYTDYDPMKLHESLDIQETWEIEEKRAKK